MNRLKKEIKTIGLPLLISSIICYAASCGVSYIEYKDHKNTLENVALENPAKAYGIALNTIKEGDGILTIFPYSDVKTSLEFITNFKGNKSAGEEWAKNHPNKSFIEILRNHP